MPIVTMADVAKEAGVSATTVARAINNSGYVSESNRKKILEIVERLGYVPNRLASGLKNQSSYIIGNIVPFSPVNLYFNQVTEALSVEAEKFGYHLISVFSDGGETHERKALEGLVSQSVDAVIFTAGVHISPKNVEWLLKMGIPVLMIERTNSVLGIDKVLLDNFGGSYQAVHHLIEMGHTKIGFIGSETYGTTEQQRIDGYYQAMKDAGLVCKPEWEALFPSYVPAYGFEGAKQLLSCEDRPTAIFASSDMYASGLLQYTHSKGISIPDDISVVGFDNTLSEYLSPALTTIGIPVWEIGKSAIKLLMERIQNKRSIGVSMCYNLSLVDRGTVKDLTKKK